MILKAASFLIWLRVRSLVGSVARVKLRRGSANADDVVYALRRVQKDANQSWVMEQIAGVRKVGPLEIEIQLKDSPRPTSARLADDQRFKLTLPQCAIFDARRAPQRQWFCAFFALPY